MEDILLKSGLTIKRTSRTVDNSTIFILNETSAWIDQYDSGEIIVVVENGEHTGFYEYESTEKELVIELIKKSINKS